MSVTVVTGIDGVIAVATLFVGALSRIMVPSDGAMFTVGAERVERRCVTSDCSDADTGVAMDCWRRTEEPAVCLKPQSEA
jgi:hypothetical protein